ncbi:hypothetical protein PSH66_10405 [Pseudomonas sp. FP597]|uniref:hypothetical protein n=1 Tax=Pseudomonas sp. FP597 TaxID=2954096 RepID=UPI00112F2D3D|nr:hypothetical protein [Pseudomonas sp. FP597]WLI08707.1 hypothetical protein PSH66_10405 [Pseudomonas sp. FP597]
MNSTSFESRHSQYAVSTLSAAASEVENQAPPVPQKLNLTSSPKSSFKAPTAEDFHKGAQARMEKPTLSAGLSVLGSLWGKLSGRQ